MLCHCDKLRILNATGQRLALPTVVGLALATFVHDVLNQVAGAGRHDLGAGVGTAEGSGQDLDCLCFFHGSNMAHFSDFCCINGYKTGKPVGELSPLAILHFTCKDTRLPNHNGQNIPRGSYQLTNYNEYVLQVL